MAMSLMRGAAAVLTVALVSVGCGGGGGTTPAGVAGRWAGDLTVTYVGGGGLSGGIGMDLTEQNDFASGIATWGGYGQTMSVAGPVDGADFTLYLHFRCAKANEAAALEARIDGNTMRIAGASGSGCSPGGEARLVDGASGTLTRTSDNIPL